MIPIDKLKLLLGKPVKVGQLTIRQPTIDEISEVGEDKYKSICLPFILNKESLFPDSEHVEGIKELTNLDLFFLEVKEGVFLLDELLGTSSLDSLKESLKFFIVCEEISFLPNIKKIVIDNEYSLDSKDFENVRKAIQCITTKEEIEIETPPKKMSDRQLGIWKKLQEGRRRKSLKDAIFTQDIINVVCLGGPSFIPIKEILGLTSFQLMTFYKDILGKDSFEIGMGYKLSQKYEVKDDVNHWSNTFKIGK